MFEDLTVIDAASYVAGPAAATVMADYGANVIKLEPPQGDGYRGLAARYRTDYNWLLTSRNKRSLALDITSDEGQKMLHRLIEKADVLIVNFNLRQLAKFQLEYDTLKAINPRLVLAQLTGYGNRGPEAGRRAFDVAAWWARTGVMDMMKPFGGPPTNGVGGVGDHASAMSMFGAIMMAL
jgi:crotonobetainyl-CoA:carnitine CoA-transferase CaiB-like acyl-CoA transferase